MQDITSFAKGYCGYSSQLNEIKINSSAENVCEHSVLSCQNSKNRFAYEWKQIFHYPLAIIIIMKLNVLTVLDIMIATH